MLIARKNDIFQITLSGFFIEENSDTDINLIKKASLVIEEGVKKCIVDIGRLNHMNSVGIGVLIVLLTKFRNAGGELILINPKKEIYNLFTVTKIESIFTIVDTYQEAKNKMKICQK